MEESMIGTPNKLCVIVPKFSIELRVRVYFSNKVTRSL